MKTPVAHRALIKFLARLDKDVLVILRGDKYYRKYVKPYMYEVCGLSTDIIYNVTQKTLSVKGHEGTMYFKTPDLNRIQGMKYDYLFVDEECSLDMNTTVQLRMMKRYVAK